MRNHSPPAVAAMPDATTAASADRRDIREAGYLPYIDGLRAVAVLSVIAYHLDSAWLPGGFTGVDIFFVISGFVVSASVDRLPPLDSAASILRF
jgi:peptidoglycan/LPS O-acetylase OafA/YrhL